jgi:mono/diheme cytochrome c family protein
MAVRALAVAVLLASALHAAGTAQQPAPKPRSTLAGVYTEAQATRGRDSYSGMCQACHTPASHSGPTFLATWGGRPLWELFKYITESMPKMDPGSLPLDEYAQVTAYILKLNGMPAGPQELAADSAALQTIQFESQKRQ